MDAYSLCFWFVLACGMITISCGVFTLCAYVASKVISKSPVIIMPGTETRASHASHVEPTVLRSKPAQRLDETKIPHNVTCGGCKQPIKTGPVRTQITDAGPVLVFNCPTCGEVVVPIQG
jgi:predicted RNA-binding Zn-ribbon protein involved in translation (DUF1610 family)